MRWLLAAPLALGVGCAFEGPAGDGDGDGCEVSCSDGQLFTCPDREPIDCPLGCDGARCARFEISNGAGDHGLDEAALGSWELAGPVVIDTDTGEVTGPRGARAPGLGIDAGVGFAVAGDAAVFAVADLVIADGARVSVRGERALIINSLGDVAINGRLDVSGGLFDCGIDSVRSCGGPGAGDGATGGSAATGCAPGQDGDEGTLSVETGGGGGGSSVMAGARGGDGDDGSDGGAGGTAAGDDCPAVDLVPLIGGSGGGFGGDEGSSPAEGGGGGGAIQISSQTRIVIAGRADDLAGILAAGAGGAGGGRSDGAGGGGSGGSILLEAPLVSIDLGVLAANGGGGGAGGNGEPGSAGVFGIDPAPGGGGGDHDGGAGGTDVPPEDGAGGFDATGGGGAASGRIRINANDGDLAGMVASPTPSRAAIE